MGRKCLVFSIKESLEDLRKMVKKAPSNLIANRLKLLIECKKREKEGVSKEELKRLTGFCGESVTQWRRMYIEGGIEKLISHNRKPNHKPLLTKPEQDALEGKLSDPENPCIGYVELLDWLEKQTGKRLKYSTLYAFARRRYHTKLKKARKSHVKKDAQAAEDFKKKTSGSSTTR